MNRVTPCPPNLNFLITHSCQLSQCPHFIESYLHNTLPFQQTILPILTLKLLSTHHLVYPQHYRLLCHRNLNSQDYVFHSIANTFYFIKINLIYYLQIQNCSNTTIIHDVSQIVPYSASSFQIWQVIVPAAQ